MNIHFTDCKSCSTHFGLCRTHAKVSANDLHVIIIVEKNRHMVLLILIADELWELKPTSAASMKSLVDVHGITK